MTLRLIAERLLPDSEGQLYISGELIHEQTVLPPPRAGFSYHLYVSPHNPGAIGFTSEITEWLISSLEERSPTAKVDGERNSRKTVTSLARRSAAPRSPTSKAASARALGGSASGETREGGVYVTENSEEMEQCESMLCYLNGLTWTRGAGSFAFAKEVVAAFAKGVPVLLVHEMPGDGQEARHGVAFGSFFAWNATPAALIKAGIYATIAVAMKSGPWREPSRVLTIKALSAQPKRNDPVYVKLEAPAAIPEKLDLSQAKKFEASKSPGSKHHKDLENLLGAAEANFRAEALLPGEDTSSEHNGSGSKSKPPSS